MSSWESLSLSRLFRLYIFVGPSCSVSEKDTPPFRVCGSGFTVVTGRVPNFRQSSRSGRSNPLARGPREVTEVCKIKTVTPLIFPPLFK